MHYCPTSCRSAPTLRALRALRSYRCREGGHKARISVRARHGTCLAPRAFACRPLKDRGRKSSVVVQLLGVARPDRSPVSRRRLLSDGPGRAGSAAAAGAPSRRAWPTAAVAEVGAGSGALPRGAAPAGQCAIVARVFAKLVKNPIHAPASDIDTSAIHNFRVPVRSVTYPLGGGLLAVLWPQGWVYWPNNGHCSPCHTK